MASTASAGVAALGELLPLSNALHSEGFVGAQLSVHGEAWEEKFGVDSRSHADEMFIKCTL